MLHRDESFDRRKAPDFEDETERLFEKYQTERSVDLRNQITERYLYAASIVARRFSGRGVEYDDLFQVASMALMKSVERFDPSKGVKFISYATPTMSGEVKNYFRDRSKLIKLPRRGLEMKSLIEKAKESLEQELLRSPTVDELAERSGCSPEDVLEAYELGAVSVPMSLDATLEDEDANLYTVLGFHDPELQHLETEISLTPLIAALSDAERMVIRGRFFEGLSQRDLAKKMNVSQMSVSRMERRALEIMRSAMQSEQIG